MDQIEMIIRRFLAIFSRTFLVFWIELALSVELTTSERLSFANDPIPTLPTRASDLEKSALNGAHASVFFRSQSDETNSTSLKEDLKSFFSDAPNAFVIETKSSYQYGDNIIFRLAFGDEIEPDKQKEITKKLCQTDSRFIVAFDFDGGEYEYWEPSPGYKLTFIEWALFPNEGFPNFFRLRSDCVYRSIASHSANAKNERDFKATAPLKFKIKLKLRNWRGLSVDFLSQELTIEPERRVLSESLSEYKERKTGFSARDELFQLFRESLLEETEEEATLKLNELENRLQKTDEYERGYFLQRVVRTLHNFMGLDKCPELQKKLGQYEEELGLIGIQAETPPILADEPADTRKIIENELEDEMLERVPEFATRPPASERTSATSAAGELREFFSSDREVLKIETSNSSFRYGEDIYFKLRFADDIELAERKEIMEKLLQCGSHMKIWALFKGKEIDYNDPLPGRTDVVGERELLVQDGIPNYFRASSENVYHSAASSARCRGDETDFDNTEPITVQIELELVDRDGRIASFASSELTVDSPFQDYDRGVKNELANKRFLFKSQEANYRRFRTSLLNNREEPALNELYRLSDSLVEDKFARGYFLQRVVRTLHKFMGIDRCPELQKKRAQYEEELGLQWIQY